MIGKTISHYKILEKLGGGGMGVVYKAEDTKLQRIVALKFLPIVLTHDEQAKQRFIHEARAASALEHSNICTVFEIDETDEGQSFIAMSYCEGETLKKKIQQGPLPVDKAVDFTIQCCRALQKAHDKGLVHRDIKPANIMISDDDEVKIVDFGLAKLSGITKLTKESTTLGTAAYMSPEQARGEDVDRRSDIWSLGVVLYEMISGRLPFDAEYEQAQIFAIINDPPKPLSSIVSGIPADLEQVIQKALCKDPQERYQHIDEMAADLKRIRRESESKTSLAAASVTQKKTASLRKWTIGAVILVILAAVLIVFQTNLFSPQPNLTPKPIVVISFKNQTGDPAYDYLQEAIPNLLITNLEQSRSLQVITWERIHDLLRQLGREDVTIIDEDLGFEICRMEGVEAIVLGSFVKAGEMFATDVKVLDVNSKRLLKSANATGEGVGSILRSQIDDLSRAISGTILSDAGTGQRTNLRISEITTPSMEAFHQYIKGRDAYEKFYFEEAKHYLNNAIRIDSTFAAAYLCLAWVHGELMEDVEEEENLEKAKVYVSLASEKTRMYINAYYAEYVEKNPDKRTRMLEEMAKRFPKEKNVYYELGVTHAGQQSYEQAINDLNKALQLDPQYGSAWNMLAYVYGDLGKFEKAKNALDHYLEVSPGQANPYDSMAELYLRMGDFKKAKEYYEKALELKSDFFSEIRLAVVAALEQDFPGAIDWTNQVIDQGITSARSGSANWYKAYFYYLSGNKSRALAEIDSTFTLARKYNSRLALGFTHWLLAWIYLDQSDLDKSALHYTKCYQLRIERSPQYLANFQADHCFYSGIVYLAQAKTDSARIQLVKLRNLLPDVTYASRERLNYRYDLLKANILLAEDEMDDAEKAFKTIRRPVRPFRFTYNILSQNFPIMQDDLARAYQERGELDKAIAAYEGLVTFDPKQNDWRLINPRYHYRLGLLYEQTGQREKAAAAYQRFLAICKCGDPQNPELSDARRRINILHADKNTVNRSEEIKGLFSSENEVK